MLAVVVAMPDRW